MRKFLIWVFGLALAGWWIYLWRFEVDHPNYPLAVGAVPLALLGLIALLLFGEIYIPIREDLTHEYPSGYQGWLAAFFGADLFTFLAVWLYVTPPRFSLLAIGLLLIIGCLCWMYVLAIEMRAWKENSRRPFVLLVAVLVVALTGLIAWYVPFIAVLVVSLLMLFSSVTP